MSAFIGNVGMFWHFVTLAFSDAILFVLGGAMLHRTERHALGVGLIVPDICQTKYVAVGLLFYCLDGRRSLFFSRIKLHAPFFKVLNHN